MAREPFSTAALKPFAGQSLLTWRRNLHIVSDTTAMQIKESGILIVQGSEGGRQFSLFCPRSSLDFGVGNLTQSHKDIMNDRLDQMHVIVEVDLAKRNIESSVWEKRLRRLLEFVACPWSQRIESNRVASRWDQLGISQHLVR